MRWIHSGLVAAFLGLIFVACDFGGSFTDVDFARSDSAGCFDTGEADLRHADVDGDGFGDADAALSRCDAPEEWVEDSGDCNDGDATVHPRADEVCGDSVDQDCDGSDEACPG
ncbi:hypothetical protein LBMAG42_20930 [Deltaproteobacteria bacterium]|nr:hypothetical protein LBMAG42_20930 [Deltaproteobacteria bacterium]